MHLKKLWYCPAVTMKGVCSSENDNDQITGGFTVYTVPKQTPKIVRENVLNYLSKKWKEIDSINNLEVTANL